MRKRSEHRTCHQGKANLRGSLRGLSTGLVLGCVALSEPSQSEAKITFADPGFKFIASRDFEIGQSTIPKFETKSRYDFGNALTPRYERFSVASATIPLKSWGKQQFYTGLRIENFHLENAKPVIFRPDHQRRGIGFLALKRRLTPMIEVELEAGGFLGDRDVGGYGAIRSYFDFQAIELKTELRAEAYKLKSSYLGSVNDSGWNWRTIGEAQLKLKGIGFLPSESTLKLDTRFEYDLGNSYLASKTTTPKNRKRFYAEGHLRYSSPLKRQDSNIWLEAYANTRNEFDLNGRIDWFLAEANQWRFDVQGIAHYYEAPKDLNLPTPEGKPESKKGWLQASLRADWTINQKHNLLFEPLVRWNFKRPHHYGDFESQVFATHKWELNRAWTLQNRIGAQYFDSDTWFLTYEPRLKYQGFDWSLEAYVREKRLLKGTERQSYLDKDSRQEHRAIGGEFKFYRSNANSNAFDIALTAEYKRYSDGRDDKQFGIKLDIAH